MLRRLGAIGDVHAEVGSLRIALAALEGTVEKIVCVGDIADGPGNLDETCALLAAYAVECVRGNHDRWFLRGELRELPDATPPSSVSPQTVEFLEVLPPSRRYQTAAGELMVCHGLGDDDMAKLGMDDQGYALEANDELQALLKSSVRLVVNGHTHRRMVRCFPDLTIINVGTLHRRHEPCFARVDFERREVQYHDIVDGTVRDAAALAF